MDLSKRAMLVSVTIVNGGLLGERRDTKASELVTMTFSVAERRAKASKYLIDRQHPSVKRVVAAAQRVREVYYRYSLPWLDSSMRLLPVKAHDAFKKKIAEAEADLREAWEAYIRHYPALIAESERDLGELFDAGQYPSVKRIRDLFVFRVALWPMPEAGHFVAEIARDAAREARKTLEDEINRKLEIGTADLVQRSRETVQTFVDKLSAYKVVDDRPIGIFRDSLVTNCKDMGKLVRSLNVTDNVHIEQIALQMERLANISAEQLRGDDPLAEKLREEKVAEGSQILAKLSALDKIDEDVSDIMLKVADYMI